MIVIKRGKEPNSLLKFRKENPDADYETDMPTDVAKDIRESKYLVYAPFPKPSDAENPLADMYYYSVTYYTDRVSQMSQEIGIDNRFKEHLAQYSKYFRLGNNLNQRDTIAVRKMISGFTKLLYPDGEVTKEELREIVEISLELRRRVKEQLKKIGGMEFYDVNLIEKNERIYEFRAEGRLNKVAIEKEVADHIVQKLYEQGRNSVGIKTCSNRGLGIYRIEIS